MKKSYRVPALGEVFGALFQDMKIESRLAHGMIYEVWKQTVGEQIAKNTCPASVRSGILFVDVSTPVWMQQLTFMKDQILEKLNSRLRDKNRFTEIRFKIGTIPQAHSTGSATPLPDLDRNETEKIEHEASSIADSELREAFQGIMAAYLKNKKKE